jgi:hypothetical protein
MTVQNKLLTVIFIQLVAALTAQAAASEHHHRRVPAISEQLRSSNAYAAPADMSVPPDMPDYAEGAMTSGIAGH